MEKNIIVWDLGGTKCTAGIVNYNETTQDLTCQKSYSIKLTDTDSLENLIHHFETQLGITLQDADAICIAAAGHFDGESLSYAGTYPYPMEFAKLARQQKWPAYAIIHDYAPIVCATFTSYMQQEKNVKRLNHCAAKPQGRRVALGIGTGLGLKDGVLFQNGDFWLGQNEIGHIGISTPPATQKNVLERHKALMDFIEHHLQQPLTFETLLSGQGLSRLHQFFYPTKESVTPEEVGIKIREGQAEELLATFAWYLGLLIGTVQLSFMPEGGVWITGGVALHHLDAFDHEDFYAGIKSSPAYLTQREQYPLGVLCNPNHALMGGGYYAAKRLL